MVSAIFTTSHPLVDNSPLPTFKPREEFTQQSLKEHLIRPFRRLPAVDRLEVELDLAVQVLGQAEVELDRARDFGLGAAHTLTTSAWLLLPVLLSNQF